MKNQRGFTLIELSIVLVIIGLIVGGVLVGQDLIKAAQLRKVITEVNSFKTAAYTFRTKYGGLPGDITNATTFWGAADADPATCVGTVSTGVETCNGNGDKRINVSTGSHESPRFWQHLANAELLSGTFSGVDGAGTVGLGCLADGSNCPTGAVSGSAYNVGYGSMDDSDFNIMAFGPSHYFVFGKNALVNGSDDDEPRGALLTGLEALDIDTKSDDSRPGYGSVISYTKTAGTDPADGYSETRLCTDNATRSLANYSAGSTVPRCAMRFMW